MATSLRPITQLWLTGLVDGPGKQFAKGPSTDVLFLWLIRLCVLRATVLGVRAKLLHEDMLCFSFYLRTFLAMPQVVRLKD